jgi:DNA repair photolyase
MPTDECLSKIDFSKYDWRKVFPVRTFAWSEEYHRDYQLIKFHRRMKDVYGLDAFTNEWVKRERLLPLEFKTVFEVGSRAFVCPLSFNADFFQGGTCNGCIYCFSIRTEQSLMTAFYDNYQFGKRRHANPAKVREELSMMLSSDRDSGYAFLAKRGIPLRIGDRAENWWYDERQKKVTLEVMKALKDFGMKYIVNTKNPDRALEEPWFKVLSESDAIVQATITTPYDEISKKIEPFAPPSSARFDAIRRLNENGIYAYPRNEPMLVTPYEDFHKYAEDYAQKCVEAHVKHTFGDTVYYEPAPGLNEIFASAGIDFRLELMVSATYARTIDMLLNCFSAIMKKYDISYSSVKYGTIATMYRPVTDCCGVSLKWGDVSFKGTLWRAVRDLVLGEKKRIYLSDIRKHGIINKKTWECIRETWNLDAEARQHYYFNPTCCPGVYSDGSDEERNLIFAYDEKLAYRQYMAVIETFGLWEMVS